MISTLQDVQLLAFVFYTYLLGGSERLIAGPNVMPLAMIDLSIRETFPFQ